MFSYEARKGSCTASTWLAISLILAAEHRLPGWRFESLQLSGSQSCMVALTSRNGSSISNRVTPRWSWIALVAHLLADAGGYHVTCGRAGVPRCMGRWPRFRLVKQSSFDETSLFASNISRLHHGGHVGDIGVATAATKCHNRTSGNSLDSGVEERRQYFWWNARGICSREAAGLLQWAFSKKVCKKDESFEKKQRPRGSWMRPWPKNGPLGRSRRIALGSANRSFNRYSMRIPTFVLPPGMYFFRECEEEVLRSRLVVRGGLRHASKLRTDSPIWSTRPPNSAFLLVTSWIWPMVFRCQKIKSTSMQACYR